MIAAIVAVNQDWGIGFNGQLLESIPEDLKRFKELTWDQNVIMGQKTWDSLPIKPLPKRNNFVISRKHPISLCDSHLRFSMEDAEHFLLNNEEWGDVFIIGGGQIYKALLPYCDKVYVTKIYKSHENVDTFFPNLDKMEEWQVLETSKLFTYKDILYQFVTYGRIN